MLVALPVIVCFAFDPLACLWFLQIASFSMTPLLIRDGLLLSYLLTNVIYLLVIRVVNCQQELPEKRPSIPFDLLKLNTFTSRTGLIYAFYASSIVGCSLLVFGLAFIPPPVKFPHLFPLLISVYSCLHFLVFFLYFNYRQFSGYYDDEDRGICVIKFSSKQSKELKEE